MKNLFTALFAVVLTCLSLSAAAQDVKFVEGQSKKPIPKGSRIYVAPMQDGFETYIIAGLIEKKVPIIIVNSKEKADYELTGISDTEKAGWAKMLFIGSQRSNEQASIKIVEIASGEVVYGYSVHKMNSYRGKQSAGEACAKHIKNDILAKTN